MTGIHRFRDRQEAGRLLAKALSPEAGERPIVLGLPRGGVPVAYEVARALGAPLDVWVVRKIGVPWYPELGLGAVAEGGFVHLSPEIVHAVVISPDDLSEATEQQRLEVEERVRRFRAGRPRPDLRENAVILIDDGIATGGTVLAAIESIRAEGPRRLVLGVPVAAPDTIRELEPKVERAVCLLTPKDLRAIGLWYENFEQVSDDEVVRLLERARWEQSGEAHHAFAQ
jgi:putative phosphoribosyl transferase